MLVWIAMLWLLAGAGMALAQQGQSMGKRLGLVIGNGAYDHVGTLRNAVRDAGDVASKLRAIGYEVQHAADLDRRGMNNAVASFLSRVEPGSDTVVFYSGHGVELQGSNYLLPVDIPALSLEQERLLRTEAVSLTELLQDIEARSARVTLVILDACRDNPFRVSTATGTRSLGTVRGLARVDPPRGTFVIFAAGVGEQALDNLGAADPSPNGLFTRNLLRYLDEDGLEIRPLVQRLRAEVRRAALTLNGHSQTPSYYDQLIGEFYFRPRSGYQAEIARNACDILVDAELSHEAIPGRDLASGVQVCARAVAEFPAEPRFSRLLKTAQEQLAFQRAVASGDGALARHYLDAYPSGRFVDAARRRLAALGPNETVDQKPAASQGEPPKSGKVKLKKPNAAKPAEGQVNSAKKDKLKKENSSKNSRTRNISRINNDYDCFYRDDRGQRVYRQTDRCQRMRFGILQ